MSNLAKFTINATPSSSPGFDAVINQALTLALEGGPAALVNRWTVSVFSSSDSTSPAASKNAPTLTLTGSTSGQNVDAATPASSVTVTMPASGVHSWIVRSTVNGGKNPDGSSNPDYVFERMVSIKTGSGIRKIVYAEQTQYGPRGWADAQNDLVDAGAGPLTAPGGSGNANQIAAANGSGTNLQYAAGLALVGSGALDWLSQAAPTTPSAGHGRIWNDSTSKKFAHKDENGLVRTLNGGGVFSWGCYTTGTTGQYAGGGPGNATSSASSAPSEWICPCAGTLSMLEGYSANSATLTVVRNLVATTLTISPSAGTARDTAHTVAVNAGDFISLIIGGTAGQRVSGSVLFTPSE